MIVVSIVMLLLSIVMIALGFRGRVVGRGVFCRRCKYDLVGQDRSSPEARCSDCGNPIYQTRRIRRVLRTRSIKRIWLGMIMMIAGGGLLIFQSGLGMKQVYPFIPDWMLAEASMAGSEPALEELLARLAKPTNTIHDESWDALIAHAIKLMDQGEQSWNPSWGELLYLAMISNHANDEQLEALLPKLYRVEFKLRSRIHAESEVANIDISLTTTGFHAEQGGELPFKQAVRIVRVELLTCDEGRSDERARIFNYPMHVRMTPPMSRSSSSTSGGIILRCSDELPQASETLKFQIHYEIEYSTDEDERIVATVQGSVNREIEVVDQHEPLIGLEIPEGGQELAAKGFSVHTLNVVYPDAWSDDGSVFHSMIMSTLQIDEMPYAFAYNIYLLTDDQHEIWIGTKVSEGAVGTLGASFGFKPDSDDPEKYEQVKQAARIMLEQGKATLVFRVDPWLASDDPEIESVLDVDLIIRDIEVVEVDQEHKGFWNSSMPKFTAEVLEED